MAKIYLEVGRKFTMHSAVARVGVSRTVSDIQIDWLASGENYGNSIAVIIDAENITYDVFIEEESGKLWFDDSLCY